MLNNILNKIEEYTVCVGILVASMVLFVNVVMRYVFNHGLVWAEELARYSIVWIVFIGSSICVRRHLHLVVDAAIIRLSERNRSIMHIFACVCGTLFSLFLVYYGYRVCLKLFSTGQILPGLEILTGYAYMAIPVGGALMSIRFFQELCRRIKHFIDPTSSPDDKIIITDAA